MSTCPGCGGIIGRDCFNPTECVNIGNSIQEDQIRRMGDLQNNAAQQINTELLQHLTEIHNRYASLMTTKMANKTIEIIARAKGTNPKTV